MIKVYNFQEYDLLIGKNAVDLFKYFNKDSFHGINLDDCINRIDEGGTYIDGFCNVNPVNSENKPFVFINQYAIKNNYVNHEKVTLLMHEFIHLSAILFIHFDIYEEEIVTFAECETNKAYTILKNDNLI